MKGIFIYDLKTKQSTCLNQNLHLETKVTKSNGVQTLDMVDGDSLIDILVDLLRLLLFYPIKSTPPRHSFLKTMQSCLQTCLESQNSI